MSPEGSFAVFGGSLETPENEGCHEALAGVADLNHEFITHGLRSLRALAAQGSPWARFSGRRCVLSADTLRRHPGRLMLDALRRDTAFLRWSLLVPLGNAYGPSIQWGTTTEGPQDIGKSGEVRCAWLGCHRTPQPMLRCEGRSSAL